MYQRDAPPDRIAAIVGRISTACWLSVTSRMHWGDMSSGHACRLCGAGLTRSFVDLGMSPLCESYLPAESVDAPEVFYPLNVLLCEECLLVQLPAYVSGEHIFSDYAYFSSYSDSWVAHAKRYAGEMTDALGLTAEQPRHRGREQRRLPAAALRRGGHPGARRRAGRQRRRGRRRQGHPDGGGVPRPGHGRRDRRRVRPGGPGRRATTSSRTCRTSAGSRWGCVPWSRTPGLVTLEFPHLLRLIERRQYDTIYHEHFSYLSLLTASRALEAGGPAGRRRRAAEHARRLAPGPRAARRGGRRALGAREGGARRGRSGRTAHGRRARGLRSRRAAHQERPAHLPHRARRPRARRWPATGRRARATRC